MRKRFKKIILGACAMTLTASLGILFGGGLLFRKNLTSAATYEAEELFVGNSGIESVTSDVDFPSYSQAGNGVKILARASGATVRYTNVIDASALDKNMNLIEFQTLSAGAAPGDLGELYVKLTDIYDNGNYVQLKFTQGSWTNNGRGEAQVQVNYDGRWMYRHNCQVAPGFAMDQVITDQTAITHGTYIDMTFHADRDYYNKNLMTDAEGKYPACGVQFDYDNGSMYVTEWKEGIGRYPNGQISLVDMFDSLVVGSGYEWTPFTTGECYLDISFQGVNDTCGIIVSEIAGQSLSGAEITDDLAPSLHIDTLDEYLVNMPVAQMGKAYILPSARAYDVLDSQVDVSIRVLKDGVDLTESVLVADKLTLVEPGEYTVRYTATDDSANKTVKDLSITCSAGVAPLSVSFAEEVGNAYVGEYLYIPELVVLGGSGNKTLTAVYYYNDERIELGSGRNIYLDKLGYIRVFYGVSDYIGSNMFGASFLEIEVSHPNKPVLQVAGVPYSIVKGKTLRLPDFTAYDYSYEEGTEDFYATKKVTVNGTDVTETLKYDVTESAGSTLSVVYEATSATGKESKTFDVQVLGGESLYDYVLHEPSVKTNKGTNTAAKYAEFIGKDDFTITLANPISADYTTLRLGVSNQNVKHLDIVLSEYYGNRSLFLRVTAYDDLNVMIQVNGEGEKYLASGSFLNDSNQLDYVFDNANGLLLNAKREKICDISTWSNGDLFGGFEKGAVKLSLRTVAMDSRVETGIRLYEISNQKFRTTGALKDTTVPVPYYYTPMTGGALKIGEVLTISAAEAYDVLDTDTNISVSVKCKVTAKDGTESYITVLEESPCTRSYEIPLNKYGIYTVTYTMTDTENDEVLAKNKKDIKYTVSDEVAPILTVHGLVSTQLKLGQKLSIPLCSAHDNYSSTNIKIYIVDTGHRYIDITGEKEYTPDKKGLYYLVVYAYDSDANMAVQSIAITVE